MAVDVVSYQPYPPSPQTASPQQYPRSQQAHEPYPQPPPAYQPYPQAPPAYQPYRQPPSAYQPYPQAPPAYQPYPQQRPAYHYATENPFLPPAPRPRKRWSTWEIVALVLTIINLVIVFLSFLLGLLGTLLGDPWSMFVVILGIVLIVLGIVAVLALVRQQDNMKAQVFNFGAALIFLYGLTVAHDWVLMAAISDTSAIASQLRSEALAAVVIDIIILVLGAVNLAAALMLKGRLWDTGGPRPPEERDTENVIYEESDTD